MNFLLFLFFYFICTFILFIILFFIFRFYFKGKCNILERVALKSIDDYFHSYDHDFLEHVDFSDFDESYDPNTDDHSIKGF